MTTPDSKYHGISCSMFPQPGQVYSERSAMVPTELQGCTLTVLDVVFVGGRWVVLLQTPWQRPDPLGFWVEQDYFMTHFKRED